MNLTCKPLNYICSDKLQDIDVVTEQSAVPAQGRGQGIGLGHWMVTRQLDSHYG